MNDTKIPIVHGNASIKWCGYRDFGKTSYHGGVAKYQGILQRAGIWGIVDAVTVR
jgi:hypothetical protein